MKSLENIRQAAIALETNSLRAALTMLGVIIGVSAMVVMVAIVQGFQTAIQRQFEGLGSRLIFILYQEDEEFSAIPRRREGLRLSDAAAIREQCDRLSHLSAERDLGEVQAVAGGKERTTRLKAVEPDMGALRGLHPVRGRFLTARDLEEWRAVCVLGPEIAAKLFETQDPIGEEVRIRGVRLTVVGVLAPKGKTLGNNDDDLIYVPLTTAIRRMTGEEEITAIYARARSEEEMSAAMDQIWGVLLRRNDNLPDFAVDSQARIIGSLNLIMVGVGLVLSGIAGLSLLVGGIGIMNIMLVSVTERTREIGIRMAVGARRGDVLWQFLIEAMTLSGVGGAVGVVLGYLVTGLVATVAGQQLPAAVPGWAAGLGLAFAVAVGVAAGMYPAVRASRLDPIQALRYE